MAADNALLQPGVDNEDEIPDLLTCPICFEPPEAEVYQCRDGHIICKKCLVGLKFKKCPTCEDPYDAAGRLIRSRIFEEMLESFRKIDCPFKSNGCDQKYLQSKMEEHKNSCHYNFEKFSKLVPLCQLIGFTGCKFQVNYGNIKEAVEHFLSTHNCIQTERRSFHVDLQGYMEVTSKDFTGKTVCWTPIISHFEVNNSSYYIITVAKFSSEQKGLGIFSVFLPLSFTNEKAPLGIVPTYIFRTRGIVEEGSLLRIPSEEGVIKWFTSTLPLILLHKAEDEMQRGFPLTIITMQKLQKLGITDKDVLFCILPLSQEIHKTYQISTELIGDWQKISNILFCKQNIFDAPLDFTEVTKNYTRWSDLKRSDAAQVFFDKKINELKETKPINRERVTAFLNEIYNLNRSRGSKSPNGISQDDFEWLNFGALFVAAQFGTVKSMQTLIKKGGDVNVVNAKGETPLHLTMHDEDKTIGLKKAKVLMEQGNASEYVFTNENRSLLHYAAWYGSPNAVWYFLKSGLELGFIDKNGQTPCHRSILHENEEIGIKITKLLVFSMGDTPNCVKDKGGNTPADLARKMGKSKLWERTRLKFVYQNGESMVIMRKDGEKMGTGELVVLSVAEFKKSVLNC